MHAIHMVAIRGHPFLQDIRFLYSGSLRSRLLACPTLGLLGHSALTGSCMLIVRCASLLKRVNVMGAQPGKPKFLQARWPGGLGKGGGTWRDVVVEFDQLRDLHIALLGYAG